MPKKSTRKAPTVPAPRQEKPHLVYVHGIGPQDPQEDLRLTWDLSLFGRESPTGSAMAYWADLRAGATTGKRRAKVREKVGVSEPVDAETVIRDLGLDPEDTRIRRLAERLLATHGPEDARGNRTRVLPPPPSWRKPECGGLRRVLAMVLEAEALERILRHLGLPFQRPSIAPARAPPQQMLPGWE